MATQNITTVSESKEWVLACSPFEQCEIESLKGDVSFIESVDIPTSETEQNNMHFQEFEPRDFTGDEVSSLWVFIDKNSKLRKRPPSKATNIAGVGTFRGALNIHDADVHTIPFNEFFHRHTGVSDTIATASSAGDIEIEVTDGALFDIGDNLQIENGVIETTFPTITNINGNVLTLDRPMDYGFEIGDNVEIVTHNMAVNGSLSNPVSFKLIPDVDQSWHVIGFSLTLIHGSSGDDSRFGDIAGGLTNGVIFRAFNGATGQYRTFTLWKTNGDISLDTGGITYNDKAGGGNFGTNALGQIKIRSGAVPKISGENGDYIEVLVQDDISSLVAFEIKAQGHLEDF